MNISGIIPALITIFKQNGEVDLQEIRKLVRLHLSEGVGGFYLCGSSAECFMLTSEERRQIVETVVDEVGQKVPIVVHVGNIWTEEAVSLAQHATACGVDAISSVPPFYYQFSFSEIVQYYKMISDATDLPLIIYNFPAFSGVSINANNIGEIIQECNIGGLKYTDYNLFEVEKIRRKYPELPILYGHDELLLNALPIGINGAIGSTFNVMAPKYKSILKAYETGDLQVASQIQREANSIIENLIQVGVFRGIKYLLNKKGINGGICRKPFRELTQEEKELLDQINNLN